MSDCWSPQRKLVIENIATLKSPGSGAMRLAVARQKADPDDLSLEFRSTLRLCDLPSSNHRDPSLRCHTRHGIFMNFCHLPLHVRYR